MERSTKGGNSYETLTGDCGPNRSDGRDDSVLGPGCADVSGDNDHLQRNWRLIALAMAGIAGTASIAALPIPGRLSALLATAWIEIVCWCIWRLILRPALERKMARNVVMLDRATWEQIRSAKLARKARKAA